MRNTKGKRDGDASKVQDAYVSGLIQQIKLLELEITYLKQHSSAGRGDGTTSSQISPKKLSSSLSPTKDPLSIANVEVSKKISSGSLKGDVQSQDHAEMAVLRKELSDRSARLEDALAVNAKLTSRLKMTEGKSVGDLDERSRRQLDKIAGLTTKCEQQEADCHVIEARYKDTIDLLEKQTITSRNRDHKIEQLNDEIETKDDQMKTTKDELETAKIEFSHLEKQMLDLQDKFMESSVHVMEETINGLGNENRILQQKLKEVQMGLEMEKEQKDRVELRCNKFITENADLASNLAEVLYSSIK
jgi:chromosome segregation ATPase